MTTLSNESLQLVWETLFPSRIYIIPTNTEKEVSNMCPKYFQTRKQCLRNCQKNPLKCRKVAEERPHIQSQPWSQSCLSGRYLEGGQSEDGVKIALNNSEAAMNCCSLLLQARRGLSKSTALPRVPLPCSIPPSFVIAARQDPIKAWSCSQPCREVHSCHIALKLIPANRYTLPFLHLLH